MDEFVSLLTVMNLSKDWPSLRNIHDFAEAKLLEANEKAGEHLTKMRAEKAKKDAEAKKKADEEYAKAQEAAKPKAIPARKADEPTDEPEADEPLVERRVE